MEHLWMDGTEPRLPDVLDDPIVRKQMASDGVSREELYRNIEMVRKALTQWETPRKEDCGICRQ